MCKFCFRMSVTGQSSPCCVPHSRQETTLHQIAANEAQKDAAPDDNEDEEAEGQLASRVPDSYTGACTAADDSLATEAEVTKDSGPCLPVAASPRPLVPSTTAAAAASRPAVTTVTSSPTRHPDAASPHPCTATAQETSLESINVACGGDAASSKADAVVVPAEGTSATAPDVTLQQSSPQPTTAAPRASSPPPTTAPDKPVSSPLVQQDMQEDTAVVAAAPSIPPVAPSPPLQQQGTAEPHVARATAAAPPPPAAAVNIQINGRPQLASPVTTAGVAPMPLTTASRNLKRSSGVGGSGCGSGGAAAGASNLFKLPALAAVGGVAAKKARLHSPSPSSGTSIPKLTQVRGVVR
jgi:hypothetical protein